MTRHLRRILILLSACLFLASFLNVAVHSQPSSDAMFRAFEAVRTAEAGGADVSYLVAQFNSLLQASSPDSSFQVLQTQAAIDGDAARSQSALTRTLAVILIPIIAVTLAVVTDGLIIARGKLKRMKLLRQQVTRT